MMSPKLKLDLAREYALLGFLREKPMHAYEIYQIFSQNRALGMIWRLKQSQLYALLGRLEDAGLIQSTLLPQINRPARRMLHLTEEGQMTYDRWLITPVRHTRDFRQEFLCKMYFAGRDTESILTMLLAGQERECRHWLADLQKQLSELDGTDRYEAMILEFRAGQVEAIIAWLSKWFGLYQNENNGDFSEESELPKP
jgi:PadR family transcriptional regulator, regulatory protein AphA